MSLSDIRARATAAAIAAGRDPASITLIAVSKEQPESRVLPVLEAGHRIFGENRVQEAAGKWPGWITRFGPVELHLLGPLQTNKARTAMELFTTIHSLDRPKLAQTLARLAQDMGHCPQLFVQVNTGAEPQKAGILPQDADSFIAQARALDLPLAGVMCIPPAADPPAPHFTHLAEIGARNGLPCLSMGMSDDFEIAIAHGATHIRVGSAIFGARG
jgi:PLP dependent protein